MNTGEEQVKKNNKSKLLIIGVIIFILILVPFVFYIKSKAVDIYLNRGEKYFDKGDYDKASYFFNKAKERDPNNWLVYVWLGGIHSQRGDYAEAFRLLDKAAELDPAQPGIYRARGWAHYDRKEYDKAIEEFKKALKLNPALAMKRSLHIGIGTIYLEYLENECKR